MKFFFFLMACGVQPHCFANYNNHKLPKYFSRFQSLLGENCLVVPPVGIIPRVIHYLKSQQAVGTLVVPLWPSSYLWPLIAHKDSRLISCGSHYSYRE